MNKFYTGGIDKPDQVSLFDKIDDTISIRGLQAGYGISLGVMPADKFGDLTGKKIVISYNGQIGELNSATNIGSGIGVFANKTNSSLNFKSLVAGKGILISQENSEIIISSENDTSFKLSNDSNPKLGGNLDVADKTIFSSHAINLLTAGNGKIILNKLTWPNSDGNEGEVLTTNGKGKLFWSKISSTAKSFLFQDLFPKLGGDLDVGNFSIFSDNEISISSKKSIKLNQLVFPIDNGNTGDSLSNNGNGNLYWKKTISKIEDDSDPKLSGNLDLQNHAIVSDNIEIYSKNNGLIKIGNLILPTESAKKDEVLLSTGKDQLYWKNIHFISEGIIYVSKNGNDRDGNGSIINPFNTINGALKNITNQKDKNISTYIIKVSPGIYEEEIILNNINLSNLLIIGESEDSVLINSVYNLKNKNSFVGKLVLSNLNIQNKIDIESNNQSFFEKLEISNSKINKIQIKNVKKSKIYDAYTGEIEYINVPSSDIFNSDINSLLFVVNQNLQEENKINSILSNINVRNYIETKIENNSNIFSLVINQNSIINSDLRLSKGTICELGEGVLIKGKIANNGELKFQHQLFDINNTGFPENVKDIKSAILNLDSRSVIDLGDAGVSLFAGKNRFTSDFQFKRIEAGKGIDLKEENSKIIIQLKEDYFKQTHETPLKSIKDNVFSITNSPKQNLIIESSEKLILNGVSWPKNPGNKGQTLVLDDVNNLNWCNLGLVIENIIFVSSNGKDFPGNGTSLNPYKTINYAINSLKNESSEFSNIIVYPGTYNEEVNVLNQHNFGLISQYPDTVWINSLNINNIKYPISKLKFINLNFINSFTIMDENILFKENLLIENCKIKGFLTVFNTNNVEIKNSKIGSFIVQNIKDLKINNVEIEKDLIVYQNNNISNDNTNIQLTNSIVNQSINLINQGVNNQNQSRISCLMFNGVYVGQDFNSDYYTKLKIDNSVKVLNNINIQGNIEQIKSI